MPRNTQVCIEDTPYYHIVLKLSPDDAHGWSAGEVLTRWTSLYKGPTLVRKFLDNQHLSPVELKAVNDCVDVYRKRLANLGWFMKCLNETVARQANKEDDCTGHFRESRYKSQALLSEEALLSAMCYVDLNPVRAGMAGTPEASDYTSIQERVEPKFNAEKAVAEQIELGAIEEFKLPIKPLQPFVGAITNEVQNGLPFTFADYLELVDFTGRAVLENKRGAISQHKPPILQRLQISPENWLANTTQFEANYYTHFAKGPPSLRRLA